MHAPSSPSLSWMRSQLTRLSAVDPGWWRAAVPEIARDRHVLAQAALAGITVSTVAVASAVALTSLIFLAAAMAIIYWIATRLLGVGVQIDPTKLN